jgi:hypothetical protein
MVTAAWVPVRVQKRLTDAEAQVVTAQGVKAGMTPNRIVPTGRTGVARNQTSPRLDRQGIRRNCIPRAGRSVASSRTIYASPPVLIERRTSNA